MRRRGFDRGTNLDVFDEKLMEVTLAYQRAISGAGRFGRSRVAPLAS
jgi:hypothetical protein